MALPIRPEKSGARVEVRVDTGAFKKKIYFESVFKCYYLDILIRPCWCLTCRQPGHY